MEKGEIRINTENIFPIIKKAVYSDHEIFLRELVSNGVDAISKRRMASMAGDCENTEEAQVKISIEIVNPIPFKIFSLGLKNLTNSSYLPPLVITHLFFLSSPIN